MQQTWPTPLPDAGGEWVSRIITLRAGYWSALWFLLQSIYAQSWNWRQETISALTPDEASEEIWRALDAMAKGASIMLGEVRWLTYVTPPDWCLVCDGTEYQRVNYPDLYAVLDPVYIIDADSFQVPDLMGDFTRGSWVPGATGGEATHQLTTDEIPAHSHTYNDPDVTTIAGLVGTVDGLLPWHSASVTGNAGGGQAHNNLPPYHTLVPVIVAKYPGS